MKKKVQYKTKKENKSISKVKRRIKEKKKKR